MSDLYFEYYNALVKQDNSYLSTAKLREISAKYNATSKEASYAYTRAQYVFEGKI